jgi:predicted transcriptional regulator
MSAERRRKVAMNSDFYRNLNEAIRKRVWPNTNLKLHQLAKAIGCSPDTMQRYQYGMTKMPAECVGPLCKLFGPSFIAEIYPEAVTLSPRDRKALRIGHAALAASEAA